MSKKPYCKGKTPQRWKLRVQAPVCSFSNLCELQNAECNNIAYDTSKHLQYTVPRPGGSVVSVSDSWPGGCEFETRLRRTFFRAHFLFSPLLKHVRKVVGGFGKKSCVSTGVRKPGNMCVTHRHDMTLAVKVALNPNTTNQLTIYRIFLQQISHDLTTSRKKNRSRKHCRKGENVRKVHLQSFLTMFFFFRNTCIIFLIIYVIPIWLTPTWIISWKHCLHLLLCV